ncbi:hypothetical protein ACFQPC_06255 [Herminiimonas glaciei]|uniref:Colicin import membrane protein n=1 Tax=Herminiimonas glaciei TaxID=523788 RepID=A0ABW2I9I6_9BURK
MKYLLHTYIAAAFLLAGPGVLAQDAAVVAEAPVQLFSPKELLQRYPADSIKSNEVAERAVAEVAAARADIEKRFAADQRSCYKQFFTTSCLDKIKEQRRIDLASIKPIEIEANSYIRHAKVDERDRRLAEKNAQNAEKAAANAGKPVDERTPKEGPGATEEAQRKARADAYAKRNAEFAEKQRLLKENEAADAQKRAENIQRYEEKVRASEEKQKEIARKKAEKANAAANKP